MLNSIDKELIEAVKSGKLEKVRSCLIDGKINLEATDEDEMTPLLLACFKGNYEIVKLLIDHGADVNYKKIPDQYSPLMFAAIGGYANVVELLLESKVDIHHKNTLNRTAKQLAAFVNQHEIVKIINNFIPKTEIEFYSQKHSQENNVLLKKYLVNPLHKYLKITNIHPIYIFRNLHNYSDLLSNLDQVSFVIEDIVKKLMLNVDSEEECIKGLKFSYLNFILNTCYKQLNKSEDKKLESENKCNKIELIEKTCNFMIKKLLKVESTKYDNLDEFIKSFILSFPYRNNVFLKLINTFDSVDCKSLSALMQLINGGKNFANLEKECNTCSNVNVDNKCSRCKEVWYCDLTCQKYDWPIHKLSCLKSL